MKLNKLPFATVLLLTVLSNLSGLEWYRSAANGVPGSSLPSGPMPSGWSLSLDRTDSEETRTLFQDGSVINTTLSIRLAGKLIAREERDATGNLVSRVEYAYDSEGNPRAIFIGVENEIYGPGRIATQQNISADSTNYRAAGGSGGDWHITEYDESRDPLNRTVLESGVVVEQSTWTRDTDGDLREEVRVQGSDVTRSLFDSNGRLQEETTTRNGAVVRLRSYSWDSDNIVRVEERGEGRTVVREMVWTGENLSSEKRSIDGITVSETIWNGNDERTEVLYRNGEAIIRVLWSGSSKIREEFLKDGEVIRVREPGR